MRKITNLSSSPFHCYNCVVRKSKAHKAMYLDFVPPSKNQSRSNNRMNRLKPNIKVFEKLTEKFSMIKISTFLRTLGSGYSEFYY